MEKQEKLKAMLDSLPDKLLREEIDFLEKTRKADKLEAEAKTIENSYIFQIATEIIEEEKDSQFKIQKKFKNELERKTELETRLRNNLEYSDKVNLLLNLRKEIKDDEIKLSYLNRRFRAACALARLNE